MKENLKKFGWVILFACLGALFLLTGYVSWGQAGPKIPAWFFTTIVLMALGGGLGLLYASLVEFSLATKNGGPKDMPRR
jgi:hypothetical protein